MHRSGEQNTSIRINPHKISGDINDFIKETGLDNEMVQPVPWNSNGCYLSSRPSFTSDPLFHGGAYYVQEASSMFLEEALKQTLDLKEPLKVLDLCAAPGGKSTLIQSLISDKSLLVSNEVIKTRVTILSENITKWGAPNVIVTNNDPKDFQRLPGYFDVIVIDAPCSGSGLFRKDPRAIEEWSEQNVALCSNRQQRILSDILPALKEGGLLIYSTCSFSTIENEGVSDWLLKNYPLTTIRYTLKEEWHIIETSSPEAGAFGYRFYPDKLKGEGFFIAAFRKAGMAGIADSIELKPRSKSFTVTAKEIELLQPWLKNGEELFFTRQQEYLLAMPLHLEKCLAEIQSALYLKKAGTTLGVIIRNELIPAHELAVSTLINTGIPTIEVDRETALQYLRKQDLKMETSIKGWALISFKKVPLGWIKALPNRINNYYPKEWRILNK